MRNVGFLRQWGIVWPAAILAGVVAGEVFRLQVVPTGAVSVLDIILGLTVVGYVIRLERGGRLRDFFSATWRHPVWKWSIIFLGLALLSLALNAPHYSSRELLVAGAYLARLAAALSLIWFANFDPPTRSSFLRIFTVAAGTLVTLGFLQLIFVPDFRFMVAHGWDPHVGRLLSTFYDPNYFGVFLVLVMVVTFGRIIETVGPSRRWQILLFVASWVALYLTYSRSAWLAGAIAVTGAALKRSWRLSLLFLLIFVGSLFLPTRLGQRFESTRHLANQQDFSKNSVQCNEASNPAQCDNSGAQRVVSLKKGVELWKHSPIIGVGYNAYGYGLVHYGIIGELRENVHSAQGSDSSLLNVLATTGLLGAVAFLAFYGRALLALRRRSAIDPVADGLFWFTIAWLPVSFFNNSMLYLLILVPWSALIGLLLVTIRVPRQ